MEYADVIADKIRAAADSRPKQRQVNDAAPRKRLTRPFSTTETLILIGASPGGTEAIRQVLEPLPPDRPAIFIPQHIPAGFPRSFVRRLAGLFPVQVHAADN